ncbi:MAG: lysine biosynthesis protein LysW [Candidatus Dojkabacteria bacterium]
MDEAVTTNRKFNCLECENEITIPEGKVVGDYFECDYCGIEYEILEQLDNGEFKIRIAEEEK